MIAPMADSLIAPMDSSVIQPEASSLIKEITLRCVMRTRKGQ